VVVLMVVIEVPPGVTMVVATPTFTLTPTGGKVREGGVSVCVCVFVSAKEVEEEVVEGRWGVGGGGRGGRGGWGWWGGGGRRRRRR
jgi:hypothetical protein